MPRRFIKLRRAAVLALAASLFARAPLGAQQQVPAPTPLRFTMRAWPDLAVVAGTTGISALAAMHGDSVSAPCRPCDRAGLWWPDRVAVGPFRSGASTASTIGLRATLAGSALLLVLSRRGEGWGPRAEDLSVYAEAVSITQVATQLVKQLTRRPRPTMYMAGVPPTVPRDEIWSFPSGHASSAFAAAAAYASILQRRGVLHQHRLEIASLATLAAATATLRVSAHKHFPTDIAAGAALGLAIGWTWPQLHPAR
jgi:undecaprenyl-diphosphatase